MGSGTGKKVAGALERITALEEQLDGIVQMFDLMVQKGLGARISALEEVMDAVVGCVGVEGVTAAIAQNRAKEMEARAQAAKAALDTALEAGRAVAASVVTENSVIAGVELDQESNVAPPGRQQLAVSSLKPEFKEKVVGQTIGAIIALPEGHEFHINEIYDLVAQPETDELPADGSGSASGPVLTLVSPIEEPASSSASE